MKILRELEKTKSKYWNIGPKLGLFLNQLIICENFKHVLEIGTSNGYSGIWMAMALKQTKGKLTTIESHKERFKLAQTNFFKSGLSKFINQIKGHAPEDIPKEHKNFDMAFFDATKYEHISYFQEISNRIKKGGLIITDNTISHTEDLKDYLKHIKSQPDWEIFNFNVGTGIAIARKLQ
ncbi:hypothetical protein GF354_03575 [Candidatus Peregrinibacteria bacterium]|nr:hypothetical protein [Candidatus Peregrinibacteria bacterium]